jgi:hypothetical protein
MSVLLVSYDLRKPGRNYEPLYEALKKYRYCHALESAWFIDTSESPSVVRDKLCKLVDSGDQIYVNRLHNHWGACRKEACTDWLQQAARTWD